jgi:hypothetical protein
MNSVATFQIGQQVKRLGPVTDYAYGRIGEVIEHDGERYRVLWTISSTGQPMKPIRTWVKPDGLEAK